MTDLRKAAEQALEALANCNSEHGHRCNRCDSEVDEGGKVAGVLRAALAAEQAPGAEALRRDAELWRRAKADAERWGAALNDASRAQLDAYRKHIGELEPARFFNFGKAVLRDSIIEYLARIEAAPATKDQP